MTSIPWLADYNALTHQAGLVDLAELTQIELRGEDRTTFLHNLCTNDIRKLPPFAGCEAFITNAQGKILCHVFVFSGNDSLVLVTVPGQGDRLQKHFEKYLIRERVEIINRSNSWACWLLAGQQATDVLQKSLSHGAIPTDRLQSSEATISHTPVWIRRVDFTSPGGFLIDCLRADFVRIGSLLQHAGAHRCSHEAFEAARIEAGLPLFGRDITEANLPQEVGRDRLAINFNKGCYLGQETVARIDALGHVNKTLVGLRYLGDHMPKPEGRIMLGDDTVGTVTSTTWSPKYNAPFALGYVRRGYNTPGMRLASPIGPAEVEVTALPIPS